MTPARSNASEGTNDQTHSTTLQLSSLSSVSSNPPPPHLDLEISNCISNREELNSNSISNSHQIKTTTAKGAQVCSSSKNNPLTYSITKSVNTDETRKRSKATRDEDFNGNNIIKGSPLSTWQQDSCRVAGGVGVFDTSGTISKDNTTCHSSSTCKGKNSESSIDQGYSSVNKTYTTAASNNTQQNTPVAVPSSVAKRTYSNSNSTANSFITSCVISSSSSSSVSVSNNRTLGGSNPFEFAAAADANSKVFDDCQYNQSPRGQQQEFSSGDSSLVEIMATSAVSSSSSLSRSSSTSSYTTYNTPTISANSAAQSYSDLNNSLTNSNNNTNSLVNNSTNYPSNSSVATSNAQPNTTNLGSQLEKASSSSSSMTNGPSLNNYSAAKMTMISESSNAAEKLNMPTSPNSRHRSRGFTDSVTFLGHSGISATGDSAQNLGSNPEKFSNSDFPFVGAGTPQASSTMQKSMSETKLDSNNEISSDGLASNSTPQSKSSAAKSSKKDTLREQKKFYRQEKKKFAQEIMSTLNDPSIEMISNFLKVRTNLKTWIRLYCVLKPGLLVLYRSQKTNKSSQWVGTVLLSACQLMERPSKKDGFCFKLFHPLEQSIWALRGPHGESTSLMGLNLPSCYLIFRALSDSDGKCWMDHLELTMKIAPARLKSSMNDTVNNDSLLEPEDHEDFYDQDPDNIEKIHFRESVYQNDLEEDVLESENDDGIARLHLDSSSTVDPNEPTSAPNSPEVDIAGAPGNPVETQYVLAPPEVMGDLAGGGQEEAVHGENKSLILTLVKQVKPGMDLSKVVLPTFILEPRSFLDKLSDYYYHCDMLTSAINQDDPFERMKGIVTFYLAGFYKKPKGLKKPYNPILGEYFRCYWQHPSGSKTFYIAEQISHHPPISSFHVSNRQEGFAISGTILAKSRFYGNSVSALFDGTAKLTLLNKGEDYDITFPYAFCKGILFGTLSMELGGKVHVNCVKTGYHTDIEFKLKPYLFGGKDSTNTISGSISLGGKKLASLDGKWDDEIFMTDFRNQTPERSKIWAVTPEVKGKRLPRYVVDFSDQEEFESEKLWFKVGEAILKGDQNAATEEKCVLEERQRKEAKERMQTSQLWATKFFKQDLVDAAQFIYKYDDYRPWDKENDMRQYENQGVIRTLTKHKIAPLVRSTSSLNGINSRGPPIGAGFTNSLDTPVEADEETSGDDRWPDSVSETQPVVGYADAAKKISLGAVPAEQRTRSRNSLSVSRTPVGSPTHSATATLALTRQMTELVEENTKTLRLIQTELKTVRGERNRAHNIITFIITVAIALLVQLLFPHFSHLFRK